MVSPNRHIATLGKLRDDELLDLNKTVNVMVRLLKKVLKPHGFNIGINIGEVAGAGIKQHLHVHIVPRWRGDTNFMPVCTNTKIISQGLKELYRALVKAQKQ